MQRPTKLYDAYIFDLDGTVYLGDTLLPTAGETITRLRALGRRTVFLSNNPTQSRERYAARLNALGLPTPAADVVNSSLAMVTFLQRRLPGATLFVVGEPSLERELVDAGFTLSERAADIDAVIASFDRTFVYHKLQVAFDAIRAGARFFATNGDRYCPVPGGGEPDAAAMIAAIEACTNTTVEAIVGKPSRFMAEAVLALVNVPAQRCLMIGDRLETDVLMALNAGMAGALTLTGATRREHLDAAAIVPTYVLSQLADLLPEAS
jgi:NagD protein